MSGERILLVDDAREVRDFLADVVLRPAGYSVVTANDGETALRLAQERLPDLILSDMQMPGLTGLALHAALAAAGKRPPFILMSAESSKELSARALKAGVTAFLAKPVDADDVLAAIRQALAPPPAARSLGTATLMLEKKVRQLETLQAVGRTLTSSLDLDKVLSRVVEAAVSLTGAEEGSLLLLDEHTGELLMRAARNFDDQFVRTFRLRSEDSLAGQVIRTGQPVILGVDSPTKIKTAYLVHSLIYMPLRMHGRVLGVLGVDNRQQGGRTFTEADKAPLAVLADFAAVAIENAQAYSRSDAERAKLDAILQETEDGVVVVDDANRIVLINRAARAAFNLDGANVENQLLGNLVNNNDLRGLLAHVAVHTSRAELTLDDGRVLNAHLTPIAGIGRAVVMQDITHLKQLDRIKSDFVTTVSHDLRSPLTAILGYVELLARVGPLNDQQTDFVRRVRYSVNAITSLITDLLDLGRVEAGFDTQKEAVNLSLVVRYAVEGLSNRAEAKKQKLATKLPPTPPPVYGNPIRLRQVASNLLDNAIKYTPEGGAIMVMVQETEDQEILMVQDSGVGIALADQPYIFDKFYRAKGVPENVPGTGLGLSIVKSIVENHGGRIWVESKPGEGSLFTVVLPKYKPEESPVPAARAAKTTPF
ncbi:MAG: response regulator [Chloroflexi bacterium]|nr:response regulator [Chloroflexota bacterium]